MDTHHQWHLIYRVGACYRNRSWV